MSTCSRCQKPLASATEAKLCAACGEAARHERMTAYRAEAAERRSIAEPENFTMVEIPRQDRRLAPLPRARRRAFESHLGATLDEAMKLERRRAEVHGAAGDASRADEGAATAPDPDAHGQDRHGQDAHGHEAHGQMDTHPPDCSDLGDLAPGQTPWWEGTDAARRLSEHLGRICATCRGACCAEGGNHAFLDVPTLRRFVRTHPRMAREEIVRFFLDRLPETSFRNACVYQGREGCVLDREHRGRICNSFECRGLRTVRRRFTEHGLSDRLFVVARDPESIQHGTFLDGESSRRCRPPRSDRSS